jgi:hypothetical protein
MYFVRRPSVAKVPIHRGVTTPAVAVRSLRAAVIVAFGIAGLHASEIVPEFLPDPRIPGFGFPESEATLTRWITELTRGDTATIAPAAFEKIHGHGWGLWTALTMETAQRQEGQRLRVFETWLTTDEVAESSGDVGRQAFARRAPLRRLAPLKIREVEREQGESPTPIERVMGFVKFDPTAVDHIVRQSLLHTTALNALLEGGAQQIPPFPSTALAVKPVFQTIRQNELVEGRYYALKTWRGPPDTPRPWGPTHWMSSVWIDILDGGNGRGAVDEFGLSDGSTRTAETTYPLSSLIHYRLSAADATALNAERAVPPASAGDIIILIAMHVSGREIARWTWQTFWWTPAPDTPPAPSSSAIAGLRPTQLRGAPRNYAMALGYTMLSPDQPYVGGSNSTPAVYVYNPWLEARLGPGDLPDSIPGFAPNGQSAANNHGVQTNCMSCHAHATYNPNQRPTAPRLTGARYVDLGAAEFVGTLQVDFLWSIARHAR